MSSMSRVWPAWRLSAKRRASLVRGERSTKSVRAIAEMVSRASLAKTWLYIFRTWHHRVLDLTQLFEQVSPLQRAEHGGGFRTESYVNVVGVVSHGKGRAAYLEQRDDLVRRHGALQLHQAPDRLLGDAARLLVTEDRDAVHLCDVDGVARRVVRHAARARVVAVAALEARDRRLEAGLGQVGERGEDAAVDPPRADVVAAAVVDLDAPVREDAPLEGRLGQQ